MDPLAELVKIDPSSIGVGQYQKDVNQSALKKSLDQTVVNCVNRVGVNLNTASKFLLTYVSGLGPVLAQNIIDYRKQNGAFRTRRELLKVPRMGAKAFEQCAGFLRKVEDLLTDSEKRKQIDIKRYVSDSVGIPTLQDIMAELEKPGRDPRKPLTQFAFDPTVHELSDLRAGMILPGIVTNITNFGAFVDVGVHTKGLVHVSQLADKFVKDPTTIISLHQHVMVRVQDVDLQRERISLSMKGVQQH